MKYLILLLLTGCSTIDPSGAVLIKWHRTEQAWRDAGRHGLIVRHSAVGFKLMENGVCHVFAPDPPMKVVDGKNEYEKGQWEILGHEVKHCFDGPFH